METYRLLDEDVPAGSCRSREDGGLGGRVLRFDAVVGTDTPTVLAGTLLLDEELRWQVLDVEADGRRLRVQRDEDWELELVGVPALHGVTTRRLASQGARPSEHRDVQVLRIDADLSARALPARYLWLSGSSWRYTAERQQRWLAVHPGDGLVRYVEGRAELVR